MLPRPESTLGARPSRRSLLSMISQPRVHQSLIDGHPLLGILFEQLSDEVFAIFTDDLPAWEVENEWRIQGLLDGLLLTCVIERQ